MKSARSDGLVNVLRAINLGLQSGNIAQACANRPSQRNIPELPVENDYAIVDVPNFIRATRNSGYKSTASAVAELVDNSLQAGATEIDIHFVKWSDPGSDSRAQFIDRLLCVDNGVGMSPETLRNALRFGGTSRFNDRSGLGRFGMGLPNASLSQCRRFDVYTWCKPDEIWHCYIDVDEVVAGKYTQIPEPVRVKSPIKEYEGYRRHPRGTIIAWRECDQLDSPGKWRTVFQSLRDGLGQVFRHLLADGRQVCVDGKKISLLDPLFLLPNARFPADGERIGERTLPIVIAGYRSEVRVLLSLLPEAWQMETKTIDRHLRGYIARRKLGFSMIRHGREIDRGLFDFRSAHHHHRWWAGEIWFEPDLDEAFGITHTKQQVKLSDALRQYLSDYVEAVLPDVLKRIGARGKRVPRQVVGRPAAEIAAEAERKTGLPPAVAAKSAAVASREMDAAEKAYEQYPDTIARVRQAVEEKRPYMLDFYDTPGGAFLDYREVGTLRILRINRHHPFFERLYQPLANEENKTGLVQVELMLFASVRALQFMPPVYLSAYEQLISKWGELLRQFLTVPMKQPTVSGTAAATTTRTQHPSSHVPV